MRPFKTEHYRSVLPTGRNIHLLLIPGYTDIMLVRIQPKRHFDITRLPVFGIFGSIIPGAIDNLSGPPGIQADIIAFPLLL